MNVIFGGAFNPPTIAHYEIAKHVLQLPLVTSLTFVPVGDHYEKPDLISACHRYRMLAIMTEFLPKTSISKVEIKSDREMKTIETLEYMQKNKPHEKFAFLMGADNLGKLTEWHDYEKLIRNFKLLILDRGELDIQMVIDEHFAFAKENFIVIDDFKKNDISSTAYRNDLSKKGFLLPEVVTYIKKHELYRREND